jgi:hypothetical protein
VPRESFADFVDRADRAMYRSKTGGRNRVTVQRDSASPDSSEDSKATTVHGDERSVADN